MCSEHRLFLLLLPRTINYRKERGERERKRKDLQLSRWQRTETCNKPKRGKKLCIDENCIFTTLLSSSFCCCCGNAATAVATVAADYHHQHQQISRLARGNSMSLNVCAKKDNITLITALLPLFLSPPTPTQNSSMTDRFSGKILFCLVCSLR